MKKAIEWDEYMFMHNKEIDREDTATAVPEGLACLCLARDQAEAVRYESLLQDMGFSALAVSGSEAEAGAFGVPIFVDVEHRAQAEELLASFEAQWDDDDDGGDFDDDDDDDDDDLYPDDMDDDFDDDDGDDGGEEDFD